MSNFNPTSHPSSSRSPLRIYLETCVGESIDGRGEDGCSDRYSPTQQAQQASSAQRSQANREQRELDRLTGVASPKTVSLSVGQIVPLLMDAMENNRTWLKDFADDTVRIDSDLYDVLLAYQQIIDRKAA